MHIYIYMRVCDMFVFPNHILLKMLLFKDVRRSMTGPDLGLTQDDINLTLDTVDCAIMFWKKWGSEDIEAW